MGNGMEMLSLLTEAKSCRGPVQQLLSRSQHFIPLLAVLLLTCLTNLRYSLVYLIKYLEDKFLCCCLSD